VPVSRKPRRNFTTDQKVAILRRHFVDKVAISDLCTEYELQPSVFYYWQRQAFENLAGALQPVVTTSSREKDLEREVEALKAKVAKKDGVIASISEEYVTLKKALGEP
jgi:transposase